ncbi:MAG: antitoxin VbhA family protein, partial [Victivallales bacterium]|nr:antitoxin VbhA family protein [Victivallales bacterium]
MPYDDPTLKEFDNYYQARSASQRERAENWAVAIGLQKVDGLIPSEHLISIAKRHIEGQITGAEATSLVDRYYETKAGHDLPEDVKEADRVSARINEVIEDDGFSFS